VWAYVPPPEDLAKAKAEYKARRQKRKALRRASRDAGVKKPRPPPLI